MKPDAETPTSDGVNISSILYIASVAMDENRKI
jgi:hypothetical protein